MNTFCEPIACAVIRQPSISRCGLRIMISRSLKVPGSDSSALTHRYVGLPVPFARKLALRPIGKPAPPRPRRFDARSSSTTASGFIPRAFASASYPPIAWYSLSFDRSRSSAWASVSSSIPTLQLLDDPRHVLGSHRLPVHLVDDHHHRAPAAARALDRTQRELPVLARLARRDAQPFFERFEHLLRS